MKPLNENAIGQFLLTPAEQTSGASCVLQGQKIIAHSASWPKAVSTAHIPILFADKVVGHLLTTTTDEKSRPLAQQLSGVLNFHLELQLKTLAWLGFLFEHLEGKRDWVGVYWAEGFLDGTPSTDLVVGPYIGPVTPHIRISADQGLCGLAAREGRTVNVDDVHADSRFLACSITTRSEIVIPIRSRDGKLIGELDIDSNTPASFSAKDQAWLEEQVVQFSRQLADL